MPGSTVPSGGSLAIGGASSTPALRPTGAGATAAAPPLAWRPPSARLVAAPAPAPICTEMIGVPTSAVAPSGTSRSATTPAYGLGSSTTALAVSISTMIWLTVTVSPGCTCHLTMSASVRPSPTSGSLNSLISDMGSLSVAEGAVNGVQDPVQIRQVVLFQP